jgi:hypothetical protein
MCISSHTEATRGNGEGERPTTKKVINRHFEAVEAYKNRKKQNLKSQDLVQGVKLTRNKETKKRKRHGAGGDIRLLSGFGESFSRAAVGQLE